MSKKINLGSKLAVYPTPVTVIGADVNGKVNWLEISHVGIVSHDRVLVSPEMLEKVGYVGSVDGDKEINQKYSSSRPTPIFSRVILSGNVARCMATGVINIEDDQVI